MVRGDFLVGKKEVAYVLRYQVSHLDKVTRVWRRDQESKKTREKTECGNSACRSCPHRTESCLPEPELR